MVFHVVFHLEIQSEVTVPKTQGQPGHTSLDRSSYVGSGIVPVLEVEAGGDFAESLLTRLKTLDKRSLRCRKATVG